MARALVVLPTVFAFYVLSVGPAACLCRQTDPGGTGPLTKIGRFVYAPIN